MRNWGVILLVFLFISCSTGTQNTSESEALDSALEGEYTYEDVSGTQMQVASKVNTAGQLIEKGYIRGGKRNGAWMTYYDGPNAGRIKSLTIYVDGKINGPMLEFSNRGQVTAEANYINNVLNGNWSKYRFGRDLEKAEYIDGKIEGVYKKFYEKNGKLQMEAEYKNGVQDGYYKFYGEDGKLQLEYQYENGEKVSGGIVTESAEE